MDIMDSGKFILKQLIQGSIIFLNDVTLGMNYQHRRKIARYATSLVTHTRKMSGLIQTRLELKNSAWNF